MRTKTKITAGVSAAVLAAAAAIGPVTHYFEPAAPTPTGMSVAYFDTLGRVWTICDGHTRDVKAGDIATPAQCAAFSSADRIIAAQTVEDCLPMLTDPNHLGGLSDAAFNLGPKVVCASTLRRKAEAGDYFGMCTQLTDAAGSDGMPNGWTTAGGPRIKGLVLRRIYDRDWCLGHKHKGFP
ncbi:MAG: glycoside hydrolase family protein [Rhodanobacter sp.]